MSFAQDTGYTPASFEKIMSFIRDGINAQFGTSYDEISFVGSNWYKYAYSIVQKVQEGEIKTAEVFQRLQEYIALTNEKIQRPSVSHPGLLDSFESNGFIASVKPPSEPDAGKVFICIDLDDTDPDYADQRLKACTLIKDFVTAGLVTQGSEEEDIVLSNGQTFTFKFELPNRIPVLLRLLATKSRNQLVAIPSDEDLRQNVFDNINARYRLGWDFEPERYFGVSDALWANDVTLEWSDDAGSSWNNTVFEAEYTDIFTFDLNDIQVTIS